MAFDGGHVVRTVTHLSHIVQQPIDRLVLMKQQKERDEQRKIETSKHSTDESEHTELDHKPISSSSGRTKRVLLHHFVIVGFSDDVIFQLYVIRSCAFQVNVKRSYIKLRAANSFSKISNIPLFLSFEMFTSSLAIHHQICVIQILFGSPTNSIRRIVHRIRLNRCVR